MAVQLLYPSSPLSGRKPDEQYADEVAAVRAAGFQVSLFSLEDFQSGVFRPTPAFTAASEVLYRGWMMSATEYEQFVTAISRADGRAFTDAKTYLASHYLPSWYPKLLGLTPETQIYSRDCDLEAELQKLNWEEYFIKDYVKSLKTSVGSRISSPDQAARVAADMVHFRGQIEGGFCVRRVEGFLPQTEQRFFVVDGVPHASDGAVPEIVFDCARRHTSRFYSVDIVERADGQLRIVEIGDGQVSDLVGWMPDRFAAVLASHFALTN